MKGSIPHVLMAMAAQSFGANNTFAIRNLGGSLNMPDFGSIPQHHYIQHKSSGTQQRKRRKLERQTRGNRK